jgi:ABC-type nitrate/sulfonate/bicarbonate transport system permease component
MVKYGKYGYQNGVYWHLFMPKTPPMMFSGHRIVAEKIWISI